MRRREVAASEFTDERKSAYILFRGAMLVVRRGDSGVGWNGV